MGIPYSLGTWNVWWCYSLTVFYFWGLMNQKNIFGKWISKDRKMKIIDSKVAALEGSEVAQDFQGESSKDLLLKKSFQVVIKPTFWSRDFPIFLNACDF